MTGRHGTPMQRLSRYVDYSAQNGCWEYQGYIRRNGYGQFYDGTRRNALAHRVMFELVVGPIPDGLQLDHLCRNRACVNPEHLEPVTARENLLRSEGVSARNASLTHCERGHEFTPENTYHAPKKPAGVRECRTCRTNRVREYKKAHPVPPRSQMTPEQVEKRRAQDRRHRERVAVERKAS